MNFSLHLGSVKGIKLKLHWTFILFMLWIFSSEIIGGKGWEQGMLSTGFILAVFGCVVLHELGHALTAAIFGCKTKSILLLPIGGIAQMEQIPEKPYQEFLMAIAGPMVNFIIATVLGIIMALTWQQIHFVEMMKIQTISKENFISTLFVVNVMLAVFNFIPAFPMDGGRVLRALLSFGMNRVKATRIAAIIGQLLAIGFIIIGIFFNFWLVLIGIFILLAARSESVLEAEKFLLTKFSVSEVVMHKYTKLNANDTIETAVKLLLDSQEKDFLIMNGDQCCGTIGRNEIIRGLSMHGNNCRLDNVMDTSPMRLHVTMNLKQVYMKMLKENKTICPVEKEGNVIGMVNLENIMEFLLMHQLKKEG